MKETTNEKIIKGALTALAINPLSSLDEIADAAGVGRATLFRHFESRPVLMRALLLYSSEKMDAATDPIFESTAPANEKLEQLVKAAIPLGASLKIAVFDPFCKFLPEYAAKLREIYEKMRKFTHELKSEKVVAPEIPDAWVAASLEKLMFTAWEKIQSGDIATNDAAELVLRTFLSGNGPSEYAHLNSEGPGETSGSQHD